MASEGIFRLPPQGNCFACGENNRHGLKMELFYNRSAKQVICSINIEEHYNGFYGITHGGIVTTLLDETMAWAAIINAENPAVTVSINVNYKLPVRTGDLYNVYAGIEHADEDYVKTHAVINDSRGKQYAHAHAIFRIIKGKSRRFGDYTELARRLKYGI